MYFLFIPDVWLYYPLRYAVGSFDDSFIFIPCVLVLSVQLCFLMFFYVRTTMEIKLSNLSCIILASILFFFFFLDVSFLSIFNFRYILFIWVKITNMDIVVLLWNLILKLLVNYLYTHRKFNNNLLKSFIRFRDNIWSNFIHWLQT